MECEVDGRFFDIRKSTKTESERVNQVQWVNLQPTESARAAQEEGADPPPGTPRGPLNTPARPKFDPKPPFAVTASPKFAIMNCQHLDLGGPSGGPSEAHWLG
jgi:hypothetical protein